MATKTFTVEYTEADALIVASALDLKLASISRAINNASTPNVRQALQADYTLVADVRRKFPS